MASTNKKTTLRRITHLALAASVFAAPLTASAFDWNAKTGAFQWRFGRDGFFTPESGHTLATACAYEEVSKRAAADPALNAALERALAQKAPKTLEQIKFSVPYQLTTFGNWGNEIFTNSGLEGRSTHEDAGSFLSGRYKKWLTDAGASKVYLAAAEKDGGYSSTYYLHSQAIDGKTQDESFDALELHLKTALASSITNLREADAAGQGLPGFKDGFKALRPEDCNDRCRGIAVLGTVFHALEDSTASCSDSVKAALKAKGLPSCEQGDGHTIIDWTSAGRPQVVTLSDDSFYQGRTDVHGNMDGLYTSCDTKNFTFEKDGKTFDFNPKFVNASILAEVFKAVGTNETPEAAAKRIYDEVIASRFAKKADRKPMPPPQPSTASKFSQIVSEVGHWWGDAVWQPVTNRGWHYLGRFVAWVDNKVGDADGWTEGVNTHWGTTGGANVHRNADTRAPGAPNTGAASPAPGAGAAGIRR